MSTLPTTERVGRAWRAHRDGNNSEAIKLFEEVIGANPENVDAHYGLGLAHKAGGTNSAASAAFQNALDLAQKALQAARTTSHVEGHVGANDLDSNDDDRFMMLTRMLNQRIKDVGGGSA